VDDGGMSFKVDFPADFGEQLRKAGHEIATDGLNQIATEIQAICDAVFDSRAGKSSDELCAELKSKLAARDFNLPEEHLRAYAHEIADGRRVKKIEVDSTP
jgi:hypothetical protein